MDRRPTDIQRGIMDQRRQIGEKLVSLRDRLQRDAGRTRLAWKRQSSRAGQRVRRGLVITGGVLGLAAVLGVGFTVWRRSARRKRWGILTRDGRGILR